MTVVRREEDDGTILRHPRPRSGIQMSERECLCFFEVRHPTCPSLASHTVVCHREASIFRINLFKIVRSKKCVFLPCCLR